MNIYKTYLYYSSFIISNGPIEREFSKVKEISYWKRNRLSDENMKIRIMIRENDKLTELFENIDINK